MAQNITLLGASYSNVPAVELPKTGGGTASFTDVTDTTAAANDVASGKYFFTANGVLTLGTNQGGSGDGYVWQDGQGYVHLSDEEGTQPIYDTLTVSSSGTFTPETGHAYNSVVVPSGSVTPASSISGTSATVSTGTNTLTLTKTVSNTPQVSAGYISSGTSGNTNVSLTASVNTRSSSDLTVSGATVTAPSGYYASQATKTVASGTAGTPTASKGAVSNHSIAVTPSVTNTTGYITGSTKTGTAVSVSASELVSGTYNVTSSGTKDVTNYASASVPSGTEGTPTATKGAVSNHSVSVTPSVTNTTGYITGSTKTGTGVTVSASELVSGTKSITENGTGIDVTNYASVDVNVESGAKNYVEGTFIYDSAGQKTLNIPYDGNGYPILIDIHVSDGMYDTTSDWYSLVSRYKVGQYSFTKGIINTAPDYDSSVSDINSGIAIACYKNSTSSATTYASNSFSTAQVFTSGHPSQSYAYRQVTMQNATQMELLVGYSQYSFATNIEYTYHIVYSE